MSDRVKHFLYLLMRDRVPVGVVASLVAEVRADWTKPYADKDLEAIADKAARELTAEDLSQ